jgi:hypothetical protein
MFYLKLIFRPSEDMANGLQKFRGIEEDLAARVGPSGRRNDVAWLCSLMRRLFAR